LTKTDQNFIKVSCMWVKAFPSHVLIKAVHNDLCEPCLVRLRY